MFKCQLVYSVATLLSAHCSRRQTAACAALGVRFKVPACDMSCVKEREREKGREREGKCGGMRER